MAKDSSKATHLNRFVRTRVNARKSAKFRSEQLESRRLLSAIPDINGVWVNDVQLPDSGGYATVNLDLDSWFDDEFTFKVRAKNIGDTESSDENNITFSFPQFSSSGDTSLVANGPDSSEEFWTYEEYLGGNYDYVMVEAIDNMGWWNWDEGEENTLQVTLEPKSYGTFTIYYRVNMSDGSEYRNDPSDSPYYDCIGGEVYRVQVDVRPMLPDAVDGLDLATESDHGSSRYDEKTHDADGQGLMFSWDDVDRADRYYYGWNDSTPDNRTYGTSVQVSTSSLNHGPNTFYVQAENAAGRGEAASINVNIDKNRPSVTDVELRAEDDSGYLNYDKYTNDTSVRFDWDTHDNGGSGVWRSWYGWDSDANDWSTGSDYAYVSPPSSNGQHTFYVACEATSGLWGYYSSYGDSETVTWDTIAPTSPKPYEPSGEISDTNPWIRWSYDSSQLWKFTVDLEEDNTLFGWMDESGWPREVSRAGAIQATGLQQGEDYQVATTATDLAGNTGTKSAWQSFRIRAAAKPDLQVTSVVMAGSRTTYTVGDQIDVTATVKNAGGANAGASKLSFYFGKSQSDDDRYFIKTVDVQALNSQQSIPIRLDPASVFWTIPPESQDEPQEYSIWVQADSGSQIEEESESNNWMSSARLTVNPAPQGLTIVTHGWQPSDDEEEAHDSWWDHLANEVVGRFGGKVISLDFGTNERREGIDNGASTTLALTGQTVLTFDWAQASNDLIGPLPFADFSEAGWREAAGDYLAAFIVGSGLAKAAVELTVNFIGHSFGAVVNSEAIRRLGLWGQDFGKLIMTTLDPHDQNQDDNADAKEDPLVTVWDNIDNAFNYWQDNAGSPTDHDDHDNGWYRLFPLPVGHPISAAWNRDLTSETGFDFWDFEPWGYEPHSRVHEWYYMTIRGCEEPGATDEDNGPGWYPNVGKLDHGYAHALRQNMTQAEMALRDMEWIDGSKTSAPSLARRIFNGDFEFADDALLESDLPGYSLFNSLNIDDIGGDHGHVANIGGGVFSDTSLDHTLTWFGPDARTIGFDLKLNSDYDSGEIVTLRLRDADGNTHDVKSLSLSKAADKTWQRFEFDVSAFAGKDKAYAIEIEVSDPGFGFAPEVLIDNLELETTPPNSAPVISGFSASPNPVEWGEQLRLAVDGATDPDGFVELMEFYLDENGNGQIDSADTFVGSDGPGGGWYISITASSAWGEGVRVFLARALDNDNAESNQLTVNVEVQSTTNQPPTLGSLVASPDDLTAGDELELAAFGESDADGRVERVEFFRDSNANGRFDEFSDEWLGPGTRANGGWRLTYRHTESWSAGPLRLFARAVDNGGLASEAVADDITVTLPANEPPTIDDLVLSPESIYWQESLAIKGVGVTDSDGRVERVEFFRDANGNAAFDESEDQWIGTDGELSGGWTWNGIVDEAWGEGPVALFARAIDDMGAASAPVFRILNVLGPTNVAPTLGAVSASPTVLRWNEFLQLTGIDAIDSDGWIEEVRFYRDTNRNGSFESGSDAAMGVDSQGDDGWQISLPAESAWGTGSVTVFALAVDNDGASSAVVFTTFELLSSENQTPEIGDLTVTPGLVHWGQAVAMAASMVRDPDGQVTAVEFYRDIDGDGHLNPGIDLRLAVDQEPMDGWTAESTADMSWETGTIRLFARAIDDLGAVSGAAVVTLEVRSSGDATLYGGTHELWVTDRDGDTFRIRLSKKQGVIWYTVASDGSLDQLLVEDIDASQNLKAKFVVSGLGGDGRLDIGSLQGYSDYGDRMTLSLRSIDFRSVDFNGAGTDIAVASTARLGDVAGIANIKGSAQKFFLGRVNTDSVLEFTNVRQVRATSLAAAGGVDFTGLERLDVSETVDTTVRVLDNSTIQRARIRGLGLSRLGLEIGDIVSLDVSGDLEMFGDSQIAGTLTSVRVRGDFVGGTLKAQSISSARVDGEVSSDASFVAINTLDDLDVRGTFQGAITAESARELNFAADCSGSVSLRGQDESGLSAQTVRIGGTARDLAFSAASSVHQFLFENLERVRLSLGLRTGWTDDNGDGLPEDTGDFENAFARIDELRVAGTTSSSTIAAGRMGSVELGTLPDGLALPTRLASFVVERGGLTLGTERYQADLKDGTDFLEPLTWLPAGTEEIEIWRLLE